MHTFSLEMQALWKILVVALVLGAGVPVLFSAGIRSMAFGAGGDAETSHAAGNPAGRVLAVVCFAICVLVVVLGLVFIIATGFGKALSFEHIYPTIVDK